MSSKMDKLGARTPNDLEYRYLFGKTFAEIMGVATDARKVADEAKKSYEGLNQEEVFKRLTNNGTWQGVYYDGNNMYINASYIKSGVIDASLIKTGNLDASLIKTGRIESQAFTEDADGSVTSGMMIDVENGVIATPLFAVNQLGEIFAMGGKIGAWTLGFTTININASESISEYALYSDEMTDAKNGKNYTYRVFLTPKGVYVDGRDNTGASYFANKTWLDICGG